MTEHEVEILMNIIRKLKENGVTCIYISHKFNEIFEICDSVSILRDGTYVGTKDIHELDRESLIYMMVGRKLDKMFPREPHTRKELSLEVKKLLGIRRAEPRAEACRPCQSSSLQGGNSRHIRLDGLGKNRAGIRHFRRIPREEGRGGMD